MNNDAVHGTIENLFSIVDLSRIKYLESSSTIPCRLLDHMSNLYSLSLINIKSLLSTLYKANWNSKFGQIRVLNINYNPS